MRVIIEYDIPHSWDFVGYQILVRKTLEMGWNKEEKEEKGKKKQKKNFLMLAALAGSEVPVGI